MKRTLSMLTAAAQLLLFTSAQAAPKTSQVPKYQDWTINSGEGLLLWHGPIVCNEKAQSAIEVIENINIPLREASVTIEIMRGADVQPFIATITNADLKTFKPEPEVEGDFSHDEIEPAKQASYAFLIQAVNYCAHHVFPAPIEGRIKYTLDNGQVIKAEP